MRSICFWMLKHVWIDVCPSCKGNEYWYWCPTHTVAGKEWAGEHKKQGAGGCYECAIGQQELSHSQAPISVSYRSPSCLVLGSTPDGPFAVSQHVVWDQVSETSVWNPDVCLFVSLSVEIRRVLVLSAHMHWNTSDQGGSGRILRFTISLAFFRECLAAVWSLWSASTRSPMIACEHTRWAHLILQDYHALAPSVLRALSVKPRPARSVLVGFWWSCAQFL